jgi:drug/metabolite transporter (DMT)-like permease
MDRLVRSLSGGGVAVVLFAALCISLSNVAAPFVYRGGGNAQTILVLRNVGFLLLCGLWLRAQGRFFWLDRRGQLVCLGAGTAYTLGAGGLLWSFTYLPVSLAILVFFTFPLMTALLESALARKLPGLGQAACLVAALAGLVVALEVERFSFDPRGVALAAGAALGIAVSYVWTHRGLPGAEATVMTFHMAITGLAVAGLLTAATGSFALPSANAAGWTALAASVLCFAGAFLAMFRGVRLIGAAPTAMLMNLEPVFTIALSVTLLSESLSGRKAVGAALVILAVVASQVLSARRPGTPTTA